MTQINLFVDMDGVLSDFEQLYISMFNITGTQLRQERKFKQYSNNWKQFIADKGFERLQLLDGAIQLIHHINQLPNAINRCILSSSAGFDHHVEIQRQKLSWLDKHNVVWPAVIVPGKKFKAGFASERSILIDDTEVVINDFRAAGGRAIHHMGDAYDVIKQLDAHLDELYYETTVSS